MTAPGASSGGATRTNEGAGPPAAPPRATADGAQRAVEALEAAAGLAAGHGREDLARRLMDRRGLLQTPSVTVCVVGEYKQGKSSLINALLGIHYLPVDDDLATAVPTSVGYGERPRAFASYDPAEDGEEAARVEEIPVDGLASYVSEAGDPSRRLRLRWVHLEIPRRLLAGGLVLVDAPGSGGLDSPQGAATIGLLGRAHAVLFLSDATQELTASEVRALRAASELCPSLLFVLTKIDLSPHWRQVRELDLEHLRRHGVDAAHVAVSSALRARAIQEQDQQLNDESGVPELLRYLSGRVVPEAAQTSLRAATADLRSSLAQLALTLDARRAALGDPERSAALGAQLTEAVQRAERLRGQSARWQQVLYDGFADLGADVDHDLRMRARTVLAEAERAIEEGDPGQRWAEFESWLRQRLGVETLEAYAGLTTAVEGIATRVAGVFEVEQAAVVPGQAPAPLALVEEIRSEHQVDARRRPLAQGLTALRNAYSGFAMFGMLGQLAGLGATGPLGLGFALLLGGTGFQSERQRQLELRRQQARSAVRQVVDEFSLRVGKDLRDAIRRMQRELRDGYAARAEEVQRSVSEALAAAQGAVAQDQTEAERERQRIAADLRAVGDLQRRCAELAPVGAGEPATP
jgi:hypothetical protein